MACLMDRAGASLSKQEFAYELRRRGQCAALDRTGMRRVLNGVRQMLDALFGEGTFAACVQFEPRHLTVGPWTFMAMDDDGWIATIGGPPIALTHPPNSGAGGSRPEAHKQDPRFRP